jgi:DNA-nicking Smr family endonuclease
MPEQDKVSPVSAPRKPRSFISGLLHFFFNKEKKKKEEKENLKEPAPAVEIDIDRPKPGEEKEPVTLPPVKAEKKIPAKARPEKHKKKKVKQPPPPPPPQMDKKGFRILNDEHDLYRLFTEKKQGTDRMFDESDDFARMFEKYLDDQGHRQMMQEKKAVPVKPKTTPLTVGERLKIYPAPQLELDLHGYTSARAEAQTEAFLRSARQNDIRTVRIIVGKGLHSEGKAVLPDVVEKKIIACKRKRWVLAYKWEKKEKFKSGAIIVYLIPD